MSRWHHRPFFAGGRVPVRDWLDEPGSLTARLRRCGVFRVELLRQGLSQANADECGILGVSQRLPCWVREVVLRCDERPVIFAHTAMPAWPRGVLAHWFARLGTRSLGSLLFAHPGFVRGQLEFARVDSRHPLYAQAVAVLGIPAAQFFLARRGTHHFRNQRVLVTEVFSPCLGATGVFSGVTGSLKAPG